MRQKQKYNAEQFLLPLTWETYEEHPDPDAEWFKHPHFPAWIRNGPVSKYDRPGYRYWKHLENAKHRKDRYRNRVLTNLGHFLFTFTQLP